METATAGRETWRAAHGPHREEAQAGGRAADADGTVHAGTSGGAACARLLRVHNPGAAGCHHIFHPVGIRTRLARTHRSNAPGVGTLSAVSLLLPQKERRAVDLPQPARAACSLARVVPMDDQAEPHPA